MFSEADVSGDGVIDLTELNDCLAKYGGFSEKELYSIMQFMDINGDFCIDKNEFMTRMKTAYVIYDE